VGLYLLDLDLNVKAQDDRQPCDNAYPTSEWRTGEIVDESRSLTLPPDLPPGPYLLAAAFYRLSDGERLPVYDRDGASSSLLMLGAFRLP
jgi:hypothetical protein